MMEFYYAEWNMRQKERERAREVEASQQARLALTGRQRRHPSLTASVAHLRTKIQAWRCHLLARSAQAKTGDPASMACP